MSAAGRLLIYGATGYTGALIVEEAARAGLRPILAARSATKLAPLARSFDLPPRVFELSDAAAVRAALDDVDVVLHAAGPYSRTGRPMVDACLAQQKTYIDLCGEIAVLEALQQRDEQARRRGVMLLAGAGFDVVPSDCLVAHLVRRLPEAKSVRLFIGGAPVLSRGSLRTLSEGIAHGTIVRRQGKLIELRRPSRATCDFGEGPRPVIGVSLGDVSTAWWSCGLPDIEVFFESSPALEQMAATPHWMRRLLATAPGQWLLNRSIDRQPIGPSPEARKSLRTTLVGEAVAPDGTRVRSVLRTAESYRLSGLTAVAIADRALRGDRPAGYQTASTAYGADFVMGIDGTEREDQRRSAGGLGTVTV